VPRAAGRRRQPSQQAAAASEPAVGPGAGGLGGRAVAPGGLGAGGRLTWRRGGRPEDLRSCAWAVVVWRSRARRRAPRGVRRLAVCGSGVGVSASGSPRRGGGWTRVATSD
jgi:hypothetical protein